MVSKGIAFEVAEYMVLGTDHAEIGARILEKWDFPAALVNAVKWHHNPETCERHCILIDIVHVANTLGLMISSGGNDNDGFQIEPAPSVTARLGLTTVHLEELAERTKQSVNKLSEVILPT